MLAHPFTDTPEIKWFLQSKIITNTSGVQAVRHRASGVVEAIFRDAGSIQILGVGALSVNQPCALIFHPEYDQVVLTAASPLAKGFQLHCVIALAGGAAPNEVNLALPLSPEDAGRSVSVNLPAAKK